MKRMAMTRVIDLLCFIGVIVAMLLLPLSVVTGVLYLIDHACFNYSFLLLQVTMIAYLLVILVATPIFLLVTPYQW